MIGRYGMDQLSKMVNYISFALLILTLFTHSMLLYILAVGGIVYSYYRAFSRNISKRYSENQAYLKVKYDVLKRFNQWKMRIKILRCSINIRLWYCILKFWERR